MHILVNPNFTIFPFISMSEIKINVKEIDLDRAKKLITKQSQINCKLEELKNFILKNLGKDNMIVNEKPYMIAYKPYMVITGDTEVLRYFVVTSS